MTEFSNLSRSKFVYVIAFSFALASQNTPKASTQPWSFFLECGKFSDKENANQKVQALGFLGLPISVRYDRDQNGQIWYELIIKGMNDADEARRTRLLIETSGGLHCRSELDR
jgi:cell division protein FtsN